MVRVIRVLPLALLLSCSRTGGGEPLPPETFAQAYAAMLEAGITSDTSLTTPAQRADSVLRAMNIDPERFKASVAYSNQDVRRWGPVLDSVVQYLNRKRVEAPAR